MAGRIVPNRPVSLDKKLPHNRRPKNEGKDPRYLAWVRQLHCCVTLSTIAIEAHHPTVGRGRMARKEDDATAVPVTRSYHSDQYPTGLHRGEAKFWNKHGVDPTSLADDLYAAFKDGADILAGTDIVLAHWRMAQTRKFYDIKIFSEKETTE